MSDKRKSVAYKFNRSIDDSAFNNYEDIYGNFTAIHSPVNEMSTNGGSKASSKKDAIQRVNGRE